MQCTKAPRQAALPAGDRGETEISPAEAYAGEVLSYMMQVVLGQTGNPKYRVDWAARGVNTDLDFSTIAQIMGDSAQNKNTLLVYDANILGLSEVLYYYNPKLNQFKGRAGSTSIYPSSEMVALRILLLQKRHRGERIHIGAILDRKSMFLDPEAAPKMKDVAETGLKPDEIRFLQDVFFSEPQLIQYLECPCLIRSLIQLGLIEEDARVNEILSQPPGRGARCRNFAAGSSPDAVKIAILPSLIPEFEFGPFLSPDSPAGFQPTPFFKDMVARLVEGIRGSLKNALADGLASEGLSEEDAASLDRHFETIWEEQVAIMLEDDRPLVIHPDNAEIMLANVCPEADLVLILTGKDIYLALDLEPADVFPAANRMYIDIMDIRRSQFGGIADEVAQFIQKRLRGGSLASISDR